MVTASLPFYVQLNTGKRRSLRYVVSFPHIFLFALSFFVLGSFGSTYGQQPSSPPPLSSTRIAPSPPISSPSPPVTVAPAATAPSLPSRAPEVTTVIHRLSGWRLATWFALNDAELTGAFNENFVHTKIVAGLVLGDGRTIVAQLPQAEIEARASMMPPHFQRESVEVNDLSGGLTVVRRNGERQRLNFVGLDGRTGLSLLEVETRQPSERVVETDSINEQTPVATTSEGARPDEVLANPLEIRIGDQVRLVAPEPVRHRANTGAQGRASVVRLRVNETVGRVMQLARTPAGSLTGITIRSERFMPAFAGAIALNETGGLVGIVEQGGNGEARVIPINEVRRAAMRVLARRASVPQPWLGANGRPVALAGLYGLIANGWRPEQARALLESQQGILLTAIAPNAPASRAGLRPGDVVVRIGEQPVRGVEDFSSLLREAETNARLQFRVLRAAETAPRDVTVHLSEELNPGRATDMAMIRGAAVAYEAIRRARRRPNNVPVTATLGFDAVTLPAKIAERFGAQQGGLLVISIHPDSDAARGGLRAGDLIEAVNERRFFPRNFNSTFRQPRNSPVMLTIVRDGQRMRLRFETAPPQSPPAP
jgi:S1-C subfamily serine protease